MNGLRSSQESAYYGLTQYSDMSEDEFVAQTLLPDLPVRGEIKNRTKLKRFRKIDVETLVNRNGFIHIILDDTDGIDFITFVRASKFNDLHI